MNWNYQDEDHHHTEGKRHALRHTRAIFTRHLQKSRTTQGMNGNVAGKGFDDLTLMSHFTL